MKTSRCSLFSLIAALILTISSCKDGMTSEIVVTAGQNWTLDCVFGGPAPDCMWKKDDTWRLDFESEGRFQLIGNVKKGNCSLQIRQVKKSDEGHWQCSSVLQDAKWIGVVHVRSNDTVNGKLNFLKSPKPIGVVLHDHVILECAFNGSAPLCFWMKDGDTISIEGKYNFIGDRYLGNCSLNITSVDRDDDGGWQCGYPRTKGMTKSLKSPMANVSIGVPPEDPVIVYNGVRLYEGDTVYVDGPRSTLTIWCFSENGKPGATLSWTLWNGDSSTKLSSGQNQVFESSQYPSLSISRIRLDQQMQSSWNQWNLSCEARHPLYGGSAKRIQIRLVVPAADYGNYRYG